MFDQQLNRLGNDRLALGLRRFGFALPAFTQQTNKPDPQLRERLITRIKARTDALDKNDAADVAANFTQDAVNVEKGAFGSALYYTNDLTAGRVCVHDSGGLYGDRKAGETEADRPWR